MTDESQKVEPPKTIINGPLKGRIADTWFPDDPNLSKFVKDVEITHEDSRGILTVKKKGKDGEPDEEQITHRALLRNIR